MSEYPRMMYAANGGEAVWGRKLRTLIVDSAAMQEAAEAEGYFAHPDLVKDEQEPETLPTAKRAPGRPRKEPQDGQD